jgi:hypothetical protein
MAHDGVPINRCAFNLTVGAANEGDEEDHRSLVGEGPEVLLGRCFWPQTLLKSLAM